MRPSSSSCLDRMIAFTETVNVGAATSYVHNANAFIVWSERTVTEETNYTT